MRLKSKYLTAAKRAEAVSWVNAMLDLAVEYECAATGARWAPLGVPLALQRMWIEDAIEAGDADRLFELTDAPEARRNACDRLVRVRRRGRPAGVAPATVLAQSANRDVTLALSILGQFGGWARGTLPLAMDLVLHRYTGAGLPLTRDQLMRYRRG